MMTIETLAQQLDGLGLDLLAQRVREGFYSRSRQHNDDAVSHLLYDLGLAAGRGLDIGLAIRSVDLANDIIEGKFDIAKDEPVADNKHIDAIYALTTVEANGQEQFVRFLNQPLMTPDPDKVGDIRKIAASMAVSGETVEIVKFVRAETVETLRAHP